MRLASSAQSGARSGNLRVEAQGVTPALIRNVALTGTVNGPVLTVSPLALSNFTANSGTNSTTQNITVSGTNLTGPIELSAPAGYEIARSGTTSFGSSLELPRNNNAVASTTVAVRLAANAPSGSNAGDLRVSSSNTLDRIVKLNGTVSPSLLVNGSIVAAKLQAFSTRFNTPSEAQSFTVGAAGLLGDVTVRAPLGFEVSVDSATYSTSLTLSPSEANATIRVRLAQSPTAVSRSGNVTITAQGATPSVILSRTVAVSGAVVAPALTVSAASLPAFSTPLSTASAPRTFTVSGTGLPGEVTLTAPSGFEISVNNGPYVDILTPTPDPAGVLLPTTISVRLASSAQSGARSGNLRVEAQGVTPALIRNVALTGTVNGPSITLSTSSISGFSTVYGSPSAARTFTVSGANLSNEGGDIMINCTPGYELSLNGSEFAPGLPIPAISGAVATKIIYVRLASSAASGAAPGAVIVTTMHGQERTISLSGSVVPSLAVSKTNLLAFTARLGVASEPQSFSITGGGLIGSAYSRVTVTAPSGFEISGDGGAHYGPSFILEPDFIGSVSGEIMVRLAAGSTAGFRSGSVTVGAQGLTTRSVGVSGSVTAPRIKPMSQVGQPRLPRYAHTQVWTGDRLIVWGGLTYGTDQESYAMSDGGTYFPATDTWSKVNDAGAPSARSAHTAVWTGTEMIVWGGISSFVWDGSSYRAEVYRDGAIYNPVSNTWRPMLEARQSMHGHTAVWTGTEMIVWGDASIGNSGMAYNPVSDTWRDISASNAPSPRQGHAAVWTGQEMAIWGGNETWDWESDDGTKPGTGALYNPANDTWRPISPTGAPAGGYGGWVAYGHRGAALLWTGSQLVAVPLNFASEVWIMPGGFYDPQNSKWSIVGTNGLPDGRPYIAVWNGRGVFVAGSEDLYFAGFSYDAGSGRWTQTIPTTTTGSFEGRIGTWAPELNEVLVFGGMHAGSGNTFSGGSAGARGFRLEQ